MADLRDSVMSFLQRTRKKFDYYAGGKFLKQHPKPKKEPKDGPPSPKPRPKSKRKRQALLPRTSPIKTPTPSPTKRNRGDSNTQIEYTNTKMQHIRGIFDPNPLNLFERRIRPYKPPAQKPPPKDKSPTTQAQPKSQPPNENTLKDIPTYNLRPSHKKQLHRPKPIQHATFILCDGEGRVEEYIIFKEAEKFYGNLYLFHDFTEDLKDCDVQTTFDERLAGEEHSAQVLAQTIARISRMKGDDLSYACRIQSVLARFNYEE